MVIHDIKTSFYTSEELVQLGFKSVGNNVFISRHACFYGAENMTIGDNVRIDDFCILSGDIEIGSWIHISAFSVLYGTKGIVLKDFSGLSPRVSVYSVSDDFSGESMTNSMIPAEYRKLKEGRVVLNKYVHVGSSSVILPEVTIEEGACIGAMSLVTSNINEWEMWAGIPAHRLKERKKNIIKLEKQLRDKHGYK